MSLIQLDDLHVSLAGKEVLAGLTCDVAASAIGLLGPNGAGKSTLVRTLLGFHPPAAGTGRVLGHDVATAGRAIRSLVGYMPEDDAFISGMTAVRMVRYMAELHGLPPADAMERAHEALTWAGLGEARYRNVETFSTGMKQRVKLAQAIVHGPRLVILDEPTNGLDPPGRQEMLRLVLELKEAEGVHLLLSSHLLRDVETVADHVLILKRGQLARSMDLAAQHRSPVRIVELEVAAGGGPPEEARRRLEQEVDRLGWEHQVSPRGRLKVVVPDERSLRELFAASLRADVTLRALSQRRDTLEDIFLDAMGDEALEPADVGA
jgi:ABC-2 type transport system ATP-binding protein